MSHNTRRRGLTSLFAAIAACGMAAISPIAASAETRIETVVGTVTTSDPIRTSYIRRTPSDQRVCETQNVPVYEEVSLGDGAELGSMIIGGLIGSAIGNDVSNSHGGGAAGAVVGAILGHEHARAVAESERRVVGYNQQQVCDVRKVMVEQTIQEITGYRHRIEIDNKIISVESSRPLPANSRIEIVRSTTYSIP